MDIKSFFGVLSVILSIVAVFPYIWSVIKGTTHPHIFSWTLYALMNLSGYLIQISNGAGAGAWNQLFSVFANLVIVVFALKYKMSKIRTFDSVLFVLVLTTLILWLYTESTVFVVIQGFLIIGASLPTIRKIIQKDGPESLSLYYVNIARHLAALFALSLFTFESVLIIFAWFIVNFSVILSSKMARKKTDNL